MKLTVYPSTLHGTVYPPPSKSITHRAYILSALAGAGVITNPLQSADTNATKTILTQMGAEFTTIKRGYVVQKGISNAPGNADCKNSGTSIRLLTGLAAVYPEESIMYGDNSLHKRPMAPLIAALEELGAKISHVNGYPPLTITKAVDAQDRHCTIAGNVSSQFISALLIMAAARTTATTIHVSGSLVSKPYLDLTLLMLREQGVAITATENKFVVKGGQLQQQNVNVPADFSSIAFHAVAGALSGNSITIKNIDKKYPQADARILDALQQMGAELHFQGTDLVVTSKKLTAINFDLRDSPDIFPILAVAAAYAKGKSILYGAEHLKYKETDRIAAVTQMLSTLGVDITATNEGAIINGTGRIQGGATVDSFGDHRIAMAAAVAAVGAEQPVVIHNAESVNVSYPAFFADLQNLGGKVKDY